MGNRRGFLGLKWFAGESSESKCELRVHVISLCQMLPRKLGCQWPTPNLLHVVKGYELLTSGLFLNVKLRNPNGWRNLL